MITLKVPAPSSMLLANLLGVLALTGVAVAVGGLTHSVWWALLAGSLEALALAVVASTRVDVEAVESDGTVSVITRAS